MAMSKKELQELLSAVLSAVLSALVDAKNFLKKILLLTLALLVNLGWNTDKKNLTNTLKHINIKKNPGLSLCVIFCTLALLVLIVPTKLVKLGLKYSTPSCLLLGISCAILALVLTQAPGIGAAGVAAAIVLAVVAAVFTLQGILQWIKGTIYEDRGEFDYSETELDKKTEEEEDA